jgi:UDP-N-acetylmuramoyl-L-alanyl-D-glutamate--2,6-diaminopimelate ligase
MPPPPAPTDVLAWLRQHAGAAANDLQPDSRRIRRGDVFIALPGRVHDGRRYIAAAVERGAAAVLAEAEGWSGGDVGVPLCAVPGLAALLGPLAARWYGAPSEGVFSVGVTGTNGKTSVSQWIAQALAAAGRRCAVIGTVGSGFPGEPLAAAARTTPDAVALQRELRRLVDAGAQALAMEVTSIGLDQGRVDGMKYDVAVFTNLTRDHLDYHGTMAAYEEAKARLFDWPTLTHAVVNLDDEAGLRLVRRLQPRVRAGALHLTGYTQHDAQHDAPGSGLSECLAARRPRTTAQGLEYELGIGAQIVPVTLPLVGSFNVANSLAVAGALRAAGVPVSALPALLGALRAPPGRMQQLGGRSAANEPLAVVDYAHTPDALEQALAALRPLAQARGGRLWAVFGAGGDRDPGKRALMGAAAARGAERIVITSDNPRSEDPLLIVRAVALGVPPPSAAHCELVVDRAAAIAHALAAADARDVVLIAGKGHEDYQEINGRKAHFSDVEQAEAALARRRTPPRPPAHSAAGAALPGGGAVAQSDGARGLPC